MATTQQDMVSTLKTIMPAVVNITATRPKPINVKSNKSNRNQRLQPLLPSDLRPREGSEGSGVIIDANKGYIVTNRHVITNKTNSIIVMLSDGQQLQAKLLGQAADYDLAVVQVNPKELINKKLTPLHFANSAKLLVGQKVAAIGSPFGLEQTVTTGIISALHRTARQLIPNATFIQTDASINPGNSGGALINQNGELIGINTAIISTTNSSNGIGFAIPSNLVKAVCDQLIKYGKINHGLLGVTTQNLNPALREAFNSSLHLGVLITQVIAGSPAEKAGLQQEDIIKKIDDYPIKNSKQLQNIIRLIAPKTKINIQIIRGNQNKNIIATVGDPKVILTRKQIRYIHGVRLENFKELQPNSLILSGAIVIGTNSSTPANLAGLQRGDIILQANHEKIKDINALIKVISTLPKGHPLLIKVSRAGGKIFLVIQDN